MDPSQRFTYRSLGELVEAVLRRGLDLPVSEDLAILGRPINFGRLTAPNRLVVQPMEGCDATEQGAPTDLTLRRYRRFGAGGAGMIWWEASAVVAEGKANPRQLHLHEGTVGAFAEMVAATRAAAAESVGYEPVCVLQMTHSGRYSRPGKAPAPILAHHSAVLDAPGHIGPDHPLISDSQLDALQEAYVEAARLAAQAGFDAVDVKSCHRYLVNELLASFTRENSRYGGDYANRTRFLRETVGRIRQALGDRIQVTCRLNVYDAIDYPYGWGVDRQDAGQCDLTEPIRLIGELRAAGLGGINVTIGNPYWNPHVNRPADWMIADWPDPPEDPLTGVARILHVVRDIQRAYPDLPVVGSGYTWLRQYVPQFAAGAIRAGHASLVGLGRGALAYPDFAKDILQTGAMDPHKVCVACSSCTQIMRDGGRSGCVVRDHEVYEPIFREGRRRDIGMLRARAAECRRCPDAMCVAGCPAGVDVPGFLGALADGEDRQAYRILRAANVLPGICGAVCPVDVQCQAGCIRQHLDEGPVPIGQIQEALSERAIEAGWAAIDVPAACSGRHVAVIGAGPAGLSAAAELLRRGHRVTVFDAAGEVGGKLASVIPPSRLAPGRAEAEIHALFDAVPGERIAWRMKTPLGEGFTLDDLLAEGFDAAILAMGLSGGPSLLDEGGPKCKGVLEANDFLRQMSRHDEHRCPRRVAVVGGGNTAVDAAVCAARHGAEDVYLVYRRSYRQMPAWSAERRELLAAGVHLLVLCQPLRYVLDGAGGVAGLTVVRTQLGAPDASGRRRPVEVPGSEFVLEVELAVEAMGERPDPQLARALPGVELTGEGLVKVDGALATSRSGVWAAGDLINGGQTVVQAVAEGRRAAEQCDVLLIPRKPTEI